MQNPIGCLVFLVIGILFPFFGGTICAFAVDGWLLGSVQLFITYLLCGYAQNLKKKKLAAHIVY